MSAPEPPNQPNGPRLARDVGRDLAGDLLVAIGFLTRVPVPVAHVSTLMRVGWAFPVVGAGVGLVGGAITSVALDLGLPVAAAAILALAATAVLTGALHEDGLADLADGFGGGRSKERTIEIMRDSSIGAFGVLALVLVTALKVSALVSILGGAEGGGAVAALVVAHAVGRGILVPVADLVPPAASSGLAHGAGRPSREVTLATCIVTAAIALVMLPATATAAAILAAVVVAFAVSVLARRRLDGITGDVLGAIEQIAETAVLLALAAMIGAGS